MGRQKVFGLGLSKTGTQSLAAALNSLGVKTKHHPIDRQTLQELKSGEYRLSILNRYDGLVDTPIPPYYAQLDEVYPGSKFILTIRDKNAWLSSAERHWRTVKAYRGRNPDADRVREFVCAVVYGSVDFNPDRFSYVYDTHERNVRQYFKDRPDDLLILNITGGEGWEKLCGFLELEIPQMPFPHKNKRRVRGHHHVSQDTDPGEAPISIPVRRDFDANASIAIASQEEEMPLHQIIKEHHASGIQLSMGQIYAIGSAIRAAAPGANVLIFGCGRDSELWNAINFDGHTVFLENDPARLDRARSGNASLQIEEVSYGDRTVSSSLPIDEEALSAYPVPEPMLDRPWDVILIDAPPGHKASAPGRSLPIYWSSKVAQAETQIFIDDYDRRLEKAYSDHFFSSSRPWTMTVPRMVDAGKPSNSSLLWVLGVESAVQDAAMSSGIPGLARETSFAANGGTSTPVSAAASITSSSSVNSPLVPGETRSPLEETPQSAVDAGQSSSTLKTSHN